MKDVVEYSLTQAQILKASGVVEAPNVAQILPPTMGSDITRDRDNAHRCS